MIKITRETDYAIVLMTAMVEEATSNSAAALAKRCRLPLPMASKILKTLAHADLLRSRRGASGGYSLARSASAISVADIIEVLEGPIAMTECSNDAEDGVCAYQTHCVPSSHWNRINAAIRQALTGVTLAEMAGQATTGHTVSVPLHNHFQHSNH